MPKKRLIQVLFLSISTLLYYLIGFEVPRYESLTLLLIYSGLFVLYVSVLYKIKQFDIGFLLGSAVIFRLIFLFSAPQLSDDYYRFIWDGYLWSSGINPFAQIPVFYMGSENFSSMGLTPELFNLINSPTHYTVYPAIPQFINVIAVTVIPNSYLGAAIIMRIFLIAAEIGTLMLILKLLKLAKFDKKRFAIYALNPLIIIEITGNLHHEGLMIFFLAATLYALSVNRWFLAGVYFAGGVASKLIPLIFLPIILLKLSVKSNTVFIVAFILTSMVLFIPLLEPAFFHGMQDSLTLYYQKLEFNGGVYFVIREIGFWMKGYNIISTSGKVLAIITTAGILLYSIWAVRKNIAFTKALTWIMLIFASMSLILHPWYIVLLIFLAVFTGYVFPIIWSYLIFLTYAGYSESGYHETPLIFVIEYLLLIMAIAWDLHNERKDQEFKTTLPFI